MYTLIGILLIITCIVLGFLVLIQNPKGGGLAGGIGGVGQQMMGVQQSTDTVEKGTWLFGGLMAVFCLLTLFITGGGVKSNKMEKSRSEEAIKNAPVQSAAPAPAPVTAPATTAPATTAPATTAPATTAPAAIAPATNATPASK
jgi:preprotein translocase subunit SecG